MRKIIFPITNRVHLPRQRLLIDELHGHRIEVLTPQFPTGVGDMATRAAACAAVANQSIGTCDLVLIRGDRFEMLPFAMTAAYRGIKVAHIEAGDLSGAVDNKVRHAIAQLSDYWFPTNEPALARLHAMGLPPERIWNFGSLDVEAAAAYEPKKALTKPYIVFAFHPVEGESEQEVLDWVRPEIGELDLDFVHIRSNGDYAQPQDGSEEFTGGEYLSLIANAALLVGNSSSFLKEASVYGTPVVNIGRRQQDRLKPKHVVDARGRLQVQTALHYQLQHGRYDLQSPYYQKGTAAKIADKIKEILS